jgi:hypothetical protein
MSIGARCGSCSRELLLGQVVQPSDGFRCPGCGFAFAPAYVTVAPAVGAQAHGHAGGPGYRARQAWVDDRRPAPA